MAEIAFTDEDIREALEYAAKRTGWAPSITEYEKVREREKLLYSGLSHEKLQQVVSGQVVNWMPSPSTIRQRYKTWEAALAVLGDKFQKPSKRNDTAFLKELVAELGKPVNEKQYEVYRKDRCPTAPHASSLIRGFGSWPEVIEAVGMGGAHHRYWSKEKLTEALIEASKEAGGALSIKQYEALRKEKGWPHYRKFLRFYDDWLAVRELVDKAIGKAPATPKPNSLLASLITGSRSDNSLGPLVQIINKLGRAPTVENYREASKPNWPTVDQIRRDHGSWKAAINRALELAKATVTA